MIDWLKINKLTNQIFAFTVALMKIMAENTILLAALGDDDLLLLTSLKEKETETFNKIDIDALSDEQFRTLFRFYRGDLVELCNALHVPNKIVCENRTTCSGFDGLSIVLRRLAYPNRLDDLCQIFGRSKAELSYIINAVLGFIDSEHGHLLDDLNQPWLSYNKLNEMADAVSRCHAPLPNCWGFIDGTVRPICRPTTHQRLVFNGHKRVHGLKFQCISTPNGMISHL